MALSISLLDGTQMTGCLDNVSRVILSGGQVTEEELQKKVRLLSTANQSIRASVHKFHINGFGQCS